MTRPGLWPRRTVRLELREPAEADLAAVLAWRNDPEVNRWLLRTEPVDAAVLLERWNAMATDPSTHFVVAVDHGHVVGTLSLEVHDGMGQGPHSPAVGSNPPKPQSIKRHSSSAVLRQSVTAKLLACCLQRSSSIVIDSAH